MLRRLRDFENFEVWSQTGRDIGRVDDFYFDEDRWTVRYVVVKTGGWLTGQSVLLSPMSIERLQWDHARIEFGLTEDQIRHAPSADLSQPISREWESEYSAYYSLPGYWVGPSLWGMWTTPAEARAAAAAIERRADAMPESRRVRSLRELTGYHIHAQDGEIGHVEDVLAADDSWSIRYLMIDTSNWIGGRTVLLAPEWASRIDWSRKQVHIDVTRAEVEASPEYDPAADIDGAYEERLAEALRRPVRR
jgi:sporulation protein YlmC with PRC-barrel domain